LGRSSGRERPWKRLIIEEGKRRKRKRFSAENGDGRATDEGKREEMVRDAHSLVGIERRSLPEQSCEASSSSYDSPYRRGLSDGVGGVFLLL